MSLAHLTKDELDVWNKLDAALRDKIGRPTLPVSDRARYVQEAREFPQTGEWHNSSIHSGEC